MTLRPNVDPPTGPSLRVLVVHNRYRSHMASGENRVVEQEIEMLRSAGHEVVPYVRHSDDIVRFSPARKLMLPARVTWSHEDAAAVTRLIARTRPDVAHVHNTFPLISPSAIHAIADRGVPCVMTLHNARLFCANGLLFRDGHPCQDCVGGSALPGVIHACYRDSRLATVPIAASITTHRRLSTWDRVARFIAPSAFLRRTAIAGGLRPDRIIVKPNFSPRPPEVRDGAGGPFLYLGRLSAEKGVDLLLRAWRPELGNLLIAGDGPARPALTRSAARSGDSVRFLGQRSSEACSLLLRSARALVLPSRVYEVFPVAVVEAFAHGVPVIAPAHGPFPDIVEDGVTGRLFEPGDPADLAASMLELRDEERSMTLGANARKEYDSRYTEDRGLEMLIAIYREAVAEGRSGQGGPMYLDDVAARSGGAS